jgi:hypothetical protein
MNSHQRRVKERKGRMRILWLDNNQTKKVMPSREEHAKMFTGMIGTVYGFSIIESSLATEDSIASK